jgi:tRNA threonylcarbamoyladenosine biosynthesis protein TsaB
MFPSATAVVTLGGHRMLADDTVTAAELQPMYLRAPDAEINWKTREGNK